MPEEIKLSASSHTVSEEMYGDGDRLYRVSFTVNDSFVSVKSHAAEVIMPQVYSPDGKDAREGDLPYIAIQEDDDVYGAVAQFKENGRVDAAAEVTLLSGRFLFRAVMECYGDLMYFYGYERCGDPYQCNGLCLVYPKGYAGTENERKLMRVLDEAAGSYTEELISESPDTSEPEIQPSAGTQEETVSGKALRTVVKTAVIVKYIRIIAGIAVIAGILICLLIGKLSDKLSVHHIVQLNGTEKIISEFTPEEEDSILEAFGVVIPAEETNVRLVSFMRGNRYENISSYIIEIDGISDPDAFFAANSGRRLGKSVNESDTRDNGIKYYITYNERITNDRTLRERDKNAQTYDRIEELFEELYEKR